MDGGVVGAPIPYAHNLSAYGIFPQFVSSFPGSVSSVYAMAAPPLAHALYILSFTLFLIVSYRAFPSVVFVATLPEPQVDRTLGVYDLFIARSEFCSRCAPDKWSKCPSFISALTHSFVT